MVNNFNLKNKTYNTNLCYEPFISNIVPELAQFSKYTEILLILNVQKYPLFNSLHK